MGDVRSEAVGPVIAEDFVVRGIGKGDRVPEGEDRPTVGRCGRRCGVREMPVQPTLTDVVGDGTVLGFDALGPGQVSDQIGGFPLQHAEIISCWLLMMRG